MWCVCLTPKSLVSLVTLHFIKRKPDTGKGIVSIGCVFKRKDSSKERKETECMYVYEKYVRLMFVFPKSMGGGLGQSKC